MSSEKKLSLLCGCCCCSSCCGRKKERFSDIGYEVIPKSYKSQWPLGTAHSGKSFTMPQGQSDLNYALLQQWGSQEVLSRSPGQMVITQQPMGRESRGSSAGAESLKSTYSLPSFGSKSHDQSPEIDFLLYYNISNFSLTVHLQRARHLPPKTEKSFVILLYLAPKTQTGDTLQSNVLQDTPDPIINRSIVFQDLKPEEVREQTLVFQLYNGSTMGNLIGGVTLPLSDADLYGMNCTMKIDLDRERIKVRKCWGHFNLYFISP